MNRLALYTFWEEHGNVHRYVEEYIKGLNEIADKVIIIVNGEISPDGVNKFKLLGADLLIRENSGFDFSAWKFAIDSLGWENFIKYDELILTNCSCYGPLFPFSELFSVMDTKNCDFWGITQHNAKKGYFERHIQSYFIVIRKNLLCSEDFKNWWINLKASQNYEEEILLHETKFTNHFFKLGYKFDTYYPCQNNTLNPTFSNSINLIQARVPLIKRKIFCTENWKNQNINFYPKRVFNCIAKHSIYDTNIVIEDLVESHKTDYVNQLINFDSILLEKYPFSLKKFFKYFLLSKITIGKTKKRYIKKYYYLSLMLSRIKQDSL